MVDWSNRGLRQEVIYMVQDSKTVGCDRLQVRFDDERAVANAGIVLPMLLAQRLDLEALVDGSVDLGERDGAANPGRKVMTLDRVLADSLTRAWRAGAGPGDGRLVVDVDSFVGQVFGHAKQGARVRLHRQARISPDPRDARRQRRGLAPASAQGRGE